MFGPQDRHASQQYQVEQQWVCVGGLRCHGQHWTCCCTGAVLLLQWYVPASAASAAATVPLMQSSHSLHVALQSSAHMSSHILACAIFKCKESNLQLHLQVHLSVDLTLCCTYAASLVLVHLQAKNASIALLTVGMTLHTSQCRTAPAHFASARHWDQCSGMGEGRPQDCPGSRVICVLCKCAAQLPLGLLCGHCGVCLQQSRQS